MGEVCGEGCDGREGRREAGSLPAHVPVVPLSRAAGSSGGRSEGGGKRGERREGEIRKRETETKQESRILSTQQQLHDNIHSRPLVSS